MSVKLFVWGFTRHREWRLFFGQDILQQTSSFTECASSSQETRNEGYSQGNFCWHQDYVFRRHMEWRLFSGQGIRPQTSSCTRHASVSQDTRNEGFSGGRIFSPKLLLVPGVRLQCPVPKEEEIPDGKPEGSLSLENIGFRKEKLKTCQGNVFWFGLLPNSNAHAGSGVLIIGRMSPS